MFGEASPGSEHGIFKYAVVVVVVAPHASLNLQIAVGNVGFRGASKN